MQAAWPGAFGALARQACEAVRAGAKRDACEQENAAAIAAANAPLALYFTWWLVYGAWLLYFGCTLPERRGWRSSFDDMRPLIAKVRVRVRVGVGVRVSVRVRVRTLTLTLILLRRYAPTDCEGAG